MKRYALGLVGSVTLACILARAEAQAGSLFPSKPGSTWEFAGTAAGKPLKMAATVVSSSTSGGKTTFMLKWTMDGRAASQETYILSATQLVRSAAGADGKTSLNPPLPVLKLPAKVGESWSWKGSMKTAGGQVSATADLKTAKQETIKVGSESVAAWRVDMRLAIANISVSNSYWFAAGKGLIKQSTTVPGPSGQPAVIEGTLVKYTAK